MWSGPPRRQAIGQSAVRTHEGATLRFSEVWHHTPIALSTVPTGQLPLRSCWPVLVAAEQLGSFPLAPLLCTAGVGGRQLSSIFRRRGTSIFRQHTLTSQGSVLGPAASTRSPSFSKGWEFQCCKRSGWR